MRVAVSKKVSAVIVSWNAKSYLAECLNSLSADAYSGSLETIVVDNGSIDGSVEMVREEFPGVRVICNGENLGFAKANNIGIRQAKGEYVALVNSDVRVLPGCITRLVAYCEANPRAGLVGPFIFGADGKQQLSCRAAPTLWNMFCRALAVDTMFPRSGLFNGYYLGHLDHSVTTDVDILSGCFWLARRDCLEEVGLLDESFFIYGEDMDWCKRFRDADWRVVFVAEAKAIHYGGASSGNSPVRFFVEKQKADLRYWKKHHSFFAVRAYITICVLHHGIRVLGYRFAGLLKRGDAATCRYKAERSSACLRWFALGEEPFQAAIN